MQSLSWLEDFDAPPPEPVDPAPEADAVLPPEPEPDPRIEAWNEGFLAGMRQAQQNGQAGQAPTAELVNRLSSIEAKLEAIAAQSAAEVAGLLIDLLSRALPPDWPDISGKLGKMTEAIRPFFHLDPKLRLHLNPPGLIGFSDIPGMATALENFQQAGCRVTIRWDTIAKPDEAIPEVLEVLASEAGSETRDQTRQAPEPR